MESEPSILARFAAAAATTSAAAAAALAAASASASAAAFFSFCCVGSGRGGGAQRTARRSGSAHEAAMGALRKADTRIERPCGAAGQSLRSDDLCTVTREPALDALDVIGNEDCRKSENAR